MRSVDAVRAVVFRGVKAVVVVNDMVRFFGAVLSRARADGL